MIFNVRVKPRSSKNEVVKNSDGSLVVYTTRPPSEGAANRAVIELLSKNFKVSKSHVRIAGGLRSKNKIVSID